MSRVDCLDLTFRSPISAAECMRILRCARGSYGDPLNPGCFESGLQADGRILLTFRGRRFSKAMRTQYLAEFADDAGGCRIVLRFHRELLGTLPMTSPRDIAQFMAEKLDAVCITTT